MIRFELLEPQTLGETCSFLAQYGNEAKIIAGGQNLLPLLRQRRIRPRFLIDIKGLHDVDYIVDGRGGVKIGALTTHRAIETSELIKRKFPVLAELERKLGCVQTRNWGTIGGNLCQASPATDLPPALIALEAKARVVGIGGERVIPLEDFFVSYQRTVLQPDEILLEVELPEAPPRSGAAYHKEVVRVNDPPIASVAAVVKLERQETIENLRIVMQAVGVVPIRARETEDLMKGEKMTDSRLEVIATLAVREARPISDAYGSADYKREMIKVITERVVKEALRQAKYYLP